MTTELSCVTVIVQVLGIGIQVFRRHDPPLELEVHLSLGVKCVLWRNIQGVCDPSTTPTARTVLRTSVYARCTLRMFRERCCVHWRTRCTPLLHCASCTLLQVHQVSRWALYHHCGVQMRGRRSTTTEVYRCRGCALPPQWCTDAEEALPPQWSTDAGRNEFGVSTGPWFDSDRKHRKLNAVWI